VLRAMHVVLEEGLAVPNVVGRRAVVEMRVERAGLRLRPGVDFQVTDPEDDPRFRAYWEDYHQRMGREGVTAEMAKAALRRSNTLIAAMMVRRGDADAMLTGLVGRFDAHLEHVRDVIGLRPGAKAFATMNAVLLDNRTVFIADTFVNDEPDAAALAEIALMAAEEVRRFGLAPKVAFVSHSMFGSSKRASARRMREATHLFKQLAPDVECDGELHGDAALSQEIRDRFLPTNSLRGEANVLILPNLDAANILFNVLKVVGGHGVTVGPVLLGAAKPAHILTPSSTMRRVVNMTALVAAEAAAARAAV